MTDNNRQGYNGKIGTQEIHIMNNGHERQQ